MTAHADDRFHPPASPDPYWTETCWFTFAVPERRLSGQLYPFFRPNQRVAAGGAYFWDESGSTLSSCRYAKNFWHLPLAEGADLADLELANGIRYRCLEPLRRYAVRYLDPDDGEVEVDLVFEAIAPPNYLGASHLDQPGRYTGTLRLQGERIPVDAFGMRDRSWGPRSQFGTTLHPGAPYSHGGYSYATASARDAFHTISAEIGSELVSIHGFLLRDGEWAKLVEGRREVLARSDGCPTRVRIHGRDALGRTLEAEGTCLNRLGLHLNPNLWTWNCLTEWRWDGGRRGFGEDHDNWSAAAFRRFVRGETRALEAAPEASGVVGLDHLAITVADVERTLAFYRRALGAELLYGELWRAGRLPVAILQVGASRLSVHAADRPAAPHARVPSPGSADVCFRWGGPLDAAAARLAAAGVAVEEGPVPRPAADGRPGASLYFRDPDGNLLELLSTAAPGRPIRSA